MTNSRPRRRTRPSGSESNECNRGTTKRRKRSAAGWAAGSQSVLIVPVKLANSPRRTQWREARRRIMEPLLRNTTNASKFDKRVHETATDSRVGETIAADGVHFAGLSDGHRLAERSLPTHPQGRSTGRGRTDRGRIRTGPGGQPPAPARPGEVRHVPGTAGATCAYSERRLDYRDSPDRNSHPGGQGSPAGGRHAAGADLRAGLSGLLVRFPARTIGTPGVGSPSETS